MIPQLPVAIGRAPQDGCGELRSREVRRAGAQVAEQPARSEGHAETEPEQQSRVRRGVVPCGLDDQNEACEADEGLTTIPEFLWELFLGVYCTFKGFRASSPILRTDAREDRRAVMPAAAPA